MNDITITYSGDLKRIDHRPGDKYVLRIDRDVPNETLQRFQSVLSKALHGAEVIVLCDGMSLEAVGRVDNASQSNM